MPFIKKKAPEKEGVKKEKKCKKRRVKGNRETPRMLEGFTMFCRGETLTAIANKFNVKNNTITKWRKKWKWDERYDKLKEEIELAKIDDIKNKIIKDKEDFENVKKWAFKKAMFFAESTGDAKNVWSMAKTELGEPSTVSKEFVKNEDLSLIERALLLGDSKDAEFETLPNLSSKK